MTSFVRPQLATLTARLGEPRRFMQILSGPRQVGKTTLVQQAMKKFSGPSHYASGDQPAAPDANWVEQQWRVGRLLAQNQPALLVLDEVQKVPRWSEAVKMLWDEDTRNGCDLRVVLLGSSQFLMQQGLSESLAGRFEQIRLPHWSFAEMQSAFDWSFDRYVYFGGYPGAAGLAGDEPRWCAYLLDSIIEPTLSRDVLQLARIDKPALLRRLFVLGCNYSGQILSYQKMIGQLQDVGNTTTLAHYLGLLGGAWLLAGLEKFSGDVARSRASSPKLLALNTALIASQLGRSHAEIRADPERWGRLVESAVGAHLCNTAPVGMQVGYWKERNHEVDFVLRHGQRVLPIEVKSGRRKGALAGMAAFSRNFGTTSGLVVGTGGIPLDVFLTTPPEAWLS
jgi:predicted AAA+ superfamily ATPase